MAAVAMAVAVILVGTVSAIIPVSREHLGGVAKLVDVLVSAGIRDVHVVLDNIVQEVHKPLNINANLHYVKFCSPSKARNYGALMSRNEILLFVDADMIISKEALKRLVEKFIKLKLTTLQPFIQWQGKVSCSLFQNAISFFYIDSCFFFIRKIDFFSVGAFSEKLRALEDVDLSLRLFKNGGVFKCSNSEVAIKGEERGALGFFKRAVIFGLSYRRFLQVNSLDHYSKLFVFKKLINHFFMCLFRDNLASVTALIASFDCLLRFKKGEIKNTLWRSHVIVTPYELIYVELGRSLAKTFVVRDGVDELCESVLPLKRFDFLKKLAKHVHVEGLSLFQSRRARLWT